MQLHPADTSGSFLEIDVQVGGEDFKGPWMPAGKNWQKAIRQEKVDGIAAAEVQSPDPAAVAERWSKILDLSVETDDAGNPALVLDNATIRFVPAEDGRGEGLGGIDVVAVDKEAVLEAAEQRGVRQERRRHPDGWHPLPSRLTRLRLRSLRSDKSVLARPGGALRRR